MTSAWRSRYPRSYPQYYWRSRALDGTHISVARAVTLEAPKGSADHGDWTGYSFLLSLAVFQPIYGAFRYIHRRQELTLVAVSYFQA